MNLEPTTGAIVSCDPPGVDTTAWPVSSLSEPLPLAATTVGFLGPIGTFTEVALRTTIDEVISDFTAGAAEDLVMEAAKTATTKEDIIARPGKTTMAKRDREKSLQAKRKEKEDKRALRKGDKHDRAAMPGGEDPDLEGLQWGPQPPLY